MVVEHQYSHTVMPGKTMLFLSEDWLLALKDALNSSEDYRKSATTWEGDIIFQIDPDGKVIKEPVRAYVNLWHGECTEARVATQDDHAEFVYSGSLENWRKLIAGELGPIRGIMSRRFRVEGSIAKLMRYVKAAQTMVATAASIPTKFPVE